MAVENLHIEFKSGFNDEVIETLTAFANTRGGRILMGVKNDGNPVKNFTIGAESIQQWLNEIKTKTQPSIIPDAEAIDYKGSEVVEFRISEYPVKPIACRGRYFKRVKNSNHQLTASEISDLYMQTMQYSWDSYPAKDYSYDDLDENKIRRFIDKVNSVGRFSLEGTPEECLRKLKFVGDDNITNAAFLLFAKDGSAYNVHLGRFKTPSMIIDDRMLRLTLFDAVEETQKYLVSQMKVAFEITGVTTQRTEILEYPLAAIRELILNTLIHRDYMSPIDVQIKMFDNYITFYNPGKLYGDLTIDDLKTDKYQANARNKMLAEAFYLTGDIEKYGSGFRRIRKELETYPTMTLQCEEVPNGFLATLSYTQQKTSSNNVGNAGEEPQPITPPITPPVTPPITPPITELEEKIMEVIGNNPYISRKAIATELGIGIDTVKEYIEKLKNKNLLSRIGNNRSGHWKIRSYSVIAKNEAIQKSRTTKRK